MCMKYIHKMETGTKIGQKILIYRDNINILKSNINIQMTGSHYYWNWSPTYLFLGEFSIFSWKLRDIFCIMCTTFMIHNLDRTYITH